ncbi:hypothetical protein B484DRAFT_453834 [Ochromonadaceae sp. CCMP2298]|nr:hypothetical protein B484DRAFT_453834 [Ochromonadaceae sp. CCMP2298]
MWLLAQRRVLRRGSAFSSCAGAHHLHRQERCCCCCCLHCWSGRCRCRRYSTHYCTQREDSGLPAFQYHPSQIWPALLL